MIRLIGHDFVNMAGVQQVVSVLRMNTALVVILLSRVLIGTVSIALP